MIGRIAFVCSDPGVPVFGRKGASVHAQAVLRVLVRAGVEVHLVTARPGGPPPPDLEEVHVHPLPAVSGTEPSQREESARRADAAVGSVLDRVAAGGPVDLVYERYSLWGVSATAWAARAGVPSVLEVNSPLVQEQAEHRVLVDRSGALDVARQAISTADAVVCVSEGVARWARARASAPGRVHVVPNGVDVREVTPASGPVTPAEGTTFTIGFVGTLKPWHGVETLVEALARLARDDDTYRLLLVGDGPCASDLRQQAEVAGVGALVETTGAVDHRTVPALLRRFDVATAPYPPSEDFYFSPLKVYEYLAAGLPVVASRVDQVEHALDGGDLGVLVDPGDAAALAEAISRLRNDPGRRTSLARRGRRRAEEAHTWESVVDRSLLAAGVRR